MPLEASQIALLVASPSLGAVTYQAASLLRQLARINDQEYLPEACRIKDVFECIAEHVFDELWAMHNQTSYSKPWAIGIFLERGLLPEYSMSCTRSFAIFGLAHHGSHPQGYKVLCISSLSCIFPAKMASPSASFGRNGSTTLPTFQ
jgi:hypothetical protein